MPPHAFHLPRFDLRGGGETERNAKRGNNNEAMKREIKAKVGEFKYSKP